MLLSWLCTRLPLAREDACKGLEDQNQNKNPKRHGGTAGRSRWQLCLATGNQTARAPLATGPARPPGTLALHHGGTEPLVGHGHRLHGDAGQRQPRVRSWQLSCCGASRPGPCHAAHKAAGWPATSSRDERATHAAARVPSGTAGRSRQQLHQRQLQGKGAGTALLSHRAE